MATQLLTAAGSNYFMDVYLGTDRMLAYFDTSGHDDQTLREVHDLQPTDEFLQWGLRKGVFKQDHQGKVTRGTNWGNPRIFCDSDAEFQRLRESVSATYGFDNAGPRPANQVSLEARANQAVAREATYAELQTDILNDCSYRVFATAASNKIAHLNDPSLGARLDEGLRAKLTAENKDVQIVVSDGLSAEAIHANLPDLLRVVLDGLRAHQLSWGDPIIAPYGRVKLAESIGNALQARLVINLIGERPGGDALASRSMSAYLAYRLADAKIQQAAAQYSGNSEIQYEFTLISNIYSAGLPPIEAGSLIVEKAIEILQHQAAGNRLENRLQR